jgi:16S rRNA (guanine(966)-N(2))-methyltransferase RsmD
MRETLFDILQTRIRGLAFLDAYAGTGAVGIEAISRGARHAFFLERNRPALDAIRHNLEELKIGPRATVLAGPVLLSLPRCHAEIAFLDPPYDQEREYAAALNLIAERPPVLTIVQHTIRFTPEEQYGVLRRTRQVRQGDNVLSFYEE